jgi:hypothetical protein
MAKKTRPITATTTAPGSEVRKTTTADTASISSPTTIIIPLRVVNGSGIT